MISGQDQEQAQEVLRKLPRAVRLIHFTQESACQSCGEARAFLEELARLSDKLCLEVFDFQRDQEQVARYRIARVPGTVMQAEKEYGIRYYAVPRHHLHVFLENIAAVSWDRSGLTPDIVARLRSISRPIRLEVFFTPNCPCTYCGRAIRLAHQFAVASEFITADLIDATQHSDLVERYAIRGVPRTILNGRVVAGAPSEEALLEQVIEASSTPGEQAEAGPGQPVGPGEAGFVLVVSSNAARRQDLRGLLAALGLEPHEAPTVAEARRLLQERSVTLVLSDTRLADGTFSDVLGAVRRWRQRAPLVVLSSQGDWTTYTAALRAGAFDYILHPHHHAELTQSIKNALRARVCLADRGDTATTDYACG